MKINTLDELFLDELKDLYDAENQITKALPKMVKAAQAPELKQAFQEHLEVTKGQLQRLVEIFEGLGKPTRGKKCEAMKGLLTEGQDLISEDAEPHVKDAGLIVAAQKVEHYEIASYGSMRTWAQLLGHEEAAKLLQETLDEEREADEKLTELAESVINIDAEEEGGEEEEVKSKAAGRR